jgi:ketosteroid isomerase-like protein
MRILLFCTAFALSLVRPPAATAATPANADRDAVVKVVQEFFDALQAKDAARLIATCHPGAQFTSVRPTSEGRPVLRQRSIEADAAQIAESKERWLERMWSPTVLIEGRMAVLWTRYDFHRDGKMSHNGTDTFTLMKGDAGWKIVNAAYTVEPSDTTQHPAGPPK